MSKLNPEAQIYLDDEVIEKTSDQFNLLTQDWQPVTTGIANTVAVLHTDEGDFFAKYYRSIHSPNRLKDELALMESLSREVPVPELRTSNSNNPFISIDVGTKTHLVTVAEEIRGAHPDNYSSPLIGQLALAHGLMHSAITPTPQSAPLDLSKDYNFYKDESDDQLNGVNRQAGNYLSIVQKVWNVLPSGLVHLDVVKNNILTENDELTGIIDFEDTSVAPYVFCLAGTLWDIRQEKGADNLDYLNYLESYQQARSLEESELNLLESMIYLRGWIALHGTLLTSGKTDTALRQLEILASL